VDFGVKADGSAFGSRRAMARGHRPQIHGGTYHVMNRGNRKCPIFEDRGDRNRFLAILNEVRKEYDVEILGDSLMGNHFHSVVATPKANISTFMEQLQGRFAQYSNWRHRRIGHLFQGRFRAVLIEDDVHLLTGLCYVFMNPVAAGFVSRMEDWKWSTYAATIGLAPAPDYLSLDWLEALFPQATRKEAQRLFAKLLNEARPVIAYLGKSDYEGDDPIRTVVRSFVGQRLRGGSVPRYYRAAVRPQLGELFTNDMSLVERNAAIHDAHARDGYTLNEIARHLDLHRESVGRIVRSFRRRSR
jgi:REP element-mobilizing transposase RayT